jgi:hypothetical protein
MMVRSVPAAMSVNPRLALSREATKVTVSRSSMLSCFNPRLALSREAT